MTTIPPPSPEAALEPEVYLDHAATSFPKPESVRKRVSWALEELTSPGRGQSKRAMDAEALLEKTRLAAARFFGVPDPSRIAFTKSATESLNVVLKGFLKRGDRVVTSSMEHNAVARPLSRLVETRELAVVRVRCFADGSLDQDAFRRALDPPPSLVVLVHASNVNGALVATSEVLALCRSHGVPVLLDAAQTAGLLPIDVTEHDLGMLACSGHKGLLGPPGVGLLYIRPDLAVEPLIEGGTGSRSEEWRQPRHMPDCFESGTPNIPGIAGLCAGLEHVAAAGVEALRSHELYLTQYAVEKLEEIPGVRVYRPAVRGGTAVSFTVDGMSPGEVSSLLATSGIGARAGLHCAPWAHQTLGTYPAGTMRFSPGWNTTQADVDMAIEALGALLARRRRRHHGREKTS